MWSLYYQQLWLSSLILQYDTVPQTIITAVTKLASGKRVGEFLLTDTKFVDIGSRDKGLLLLNLTFLVHTPESL